MFLENILALEENVFEGLIDLANRRVKMCKDSNRIMLFMCKASNYLNSEEKAFLY